MLSQSLHNVNSQLCTKAHKEGTIPIGLAVSQRTHDHFVFRANSAEERQFLAALFASRSQLRYRVAMKMSSNANADPEDLLRLARGQSGPALGQLLEMYRNYL